MKEKSVKGLGNIELSWAREIYDGVNLEHLMSVNINKEQKTFLVEFNPQTANLIPVVTTGPFVLGRYKMSKIVKEYENKGYHLIFGLNGDAYDVSNGIPIGITINNGVLLLTAQSEYGFGLTKEGKLQYGKANLPITYTLDNKNYYKISHVNRDRKEEADEIYLYTKHYYPTTNSNYQGIEVILKVVNQDELKVGVPYELEVSQIVEVSNKISGNKTKIAKNKAILAASSLTNAYNQLKQLKIGDKLIVNVSDNEEKTITWSNILYGMGMYHLLLDKGVPTKHYNNPAVHPRTAMGVKEDGTIIFMQNDGRQVGWAKGVTFKEMVDFMQEELGAVSVFNFDGGGSSTIMATLPGSNTATILNSPSDGRERDNANAILFFAKLAKMTNNEVKKLHIYPQIDNNYSTKTLLLEGGKMPFYTTATNKDYLPVDLPKKLNYDVEGDIGTINKAGVFTAKKGSGKGKVIVSSNKIKAEYNIEVVNQITKIETSQTIISVAINKPKDLYFKVYKDGVPVILTNDSLNFKVNPNDVAKINESGQFIGLKNGTGTLAVSYGNYHIKIPFEVGRLPEMILDFETDIFNNGYRQTDINIPTSGGYGKLSMNDDERFVKHGDGSLKIDYDFATKPLTGIVAIELDHQQGITLPGQPGAIGAWVYGDGNGAWFKIQLAGGKLIGDTIIDFIGWRYIEIKIPLDTEHPYVLQKPVRLLGTPKIANNKKGTIYVDSIRAVYDFKNDDNHEPVLITNSLYPKENTTITETQHLISLVVKDQEGYNISTTGINIKRSQMFINNHLATNLQQTVNSDGSVTISYNPSALDRLVPGTQQIKVRVEDNFGNKKFIEWSFNI